MDSTTPRLLGITLRLVRLGGLAQGQALFLTILSLVLLAAPAALRAEEQLEEIPPILKRTEASPLPQEQTMPEWQVDKPYGKTYQEWEKEYPSSEKWDDESEWEEKREWKKEEWERGDEQKFTGESDKDQWLSEFQSRLSALSDEDQRCVEEVLAAKKSRCEASSVPDCVAKTAFKTLVQEGKCGLEALDSVDMEGERPMEVKEFGRESQMGCIPWFATREGVKANMRGGSPEEIIKKYEVQKQWMVQMAKEKGANAEEFLKGYDTLPVCPKSQGVQGQVVTPGGMPGRGSPVEGVKMMDIGAIFGQAVGMLVSLSQDPNLPDDVRANVNAALVWFSEKVAAIAGGAKAEEFLPDAKAKLEGIMQKIGGAFGVGGSGGPDISRMREEVDRMLKDFRGMLETIPMAIARMRELFAERGVPVDFGSEWESLVATLKEHLAKIEATCANAETHDTFRACFEALKGFPPRMDQLKRLVEEIVRWRSAVPPEEMQEVMQKVSEEFFQKFEMGPPQNSMAPGTVPNGMSPGTYPNRGPEQQWMQPPMPQGDQGFPRMDPPPWMQQGAQSPMPFPNGETPFNGTQGEQYPPQFTDPRMMPFQKPDAGRDLKRSFEHWEEGTEGE